MTAAGAARSAGGRSESTPLLGIRYPCGGDTINPAVFQTFAQDIEAALAAGDAAAAAAANRPSAYVRSQVPPNQSVVVNTATTMTYTEEVWDNDNMANLAVNNDRLTIRTGGLYLCGASAATLFGFTTITSLSVSLMLNGTTLLWRRQKQGDSGIGVAALTRVLLELSPGDVLQAQCRWTWTGGPTNITSRALTASLIATN
ncbi:hypothetical protein Cs7R123_37230 [Catellatospora sp. TT07R-123]|uniref:hypothetical protein n=1 Tax=Catellatospora sp. TT07R-123 TaxID=2733863 RepID=UPI001B123EFB|nr:hypothetical protein [Catellatospora sp. TT07R-123]GHJ46381.1 hypothetical protein Cs7R123_37230 [Catellatospora sp. TT07R-123]